MNFKSFYLTEAPKEFNYIQYFVDKIEKVLKDFSKNRKRYEKYDTDDGYVIPLKDIIPEKNFRTNGVMEKLREVTLMLAYGSLSFSNKPIITIVRKQKDGSEKEYTSSAFYNINKKIIVIPFINHKNNVVMDSNIDRTTSTIFHELTHAYQDVSGKELKGTVGKAEKQWYAQPQEREAVLNQIYKETQKIIRTKIKNNKSDREEFNKTKDADFIKEYVKVNNELVGMFEDVEEFEKWFNANARWMIKYTNSMLDERIDYLKKFYEEEWDDFILNSYIELKKEFKNVLPTKILKYGDRK
jgi:hypothetical protein